MKMGIEEFLLVFLALIAIFGIIGLVIYDNEFIPKTYSIDGTNIVCNSGRAYNCGFSLQDCSDGQDRECVTNVIVKNNNPKP